MTLSQGQVLNERYRIAHLINQSGHGAIYRAWDLQNQVSCILKEHLDASLLERDLFRSEAARLFQLNHPNLPRVFDFFSIPEQGEYLVMEYIDGQDLAAMLAAADRRPPATVSGQPSAAGLPEAQIIPWFLQACEALNYLHSQVPPILHGDIKPVNLRITPEGRLVLVDLGFSHLAEPSVRRAASREVSSGFSAPEQYGASLLDVRSDVYALGAALYTLLTGVTPPDGVDLMTGAASLAPARQINPLLTPEVDRLIMQAMQPSRNARLPDMRAFQAGLTAAYTRLAAVHPTSAGATVVTAVGASAVSAARSSAGGPPSAAPPVAAPASAEGQSRNLTRILLIAIAAILVLCVLIASLWFLFSRRGENQAANPTGTQAAQTLEAQVTLNTGQTATTAAFLTSVAPTQPGTPSPQVETPTPTQAGQTPEPTKANCTRASFVSDVTIPDNTVMNPRTSFTKVWRVRNDSTCTWNVGYAIVFSGGSNLSSQNAVPFPGQVAPGQTVDLAVDMVAPPASGAYQSNWLLRTPENVTFGVSGDNPLYVRIIVTQPIPPDPRFTYDFTANYCNAQWRTAAGVIGCNNLSSDVRGSALALAVVPLESRQENEPGLWVRPDQNPNGFITSEYPPYTIQPGDHFVAEIGCAQGSNGCDVRFVLEMLYGSGLISLGSWNEDYDNQTRVLDIDLSSYAGQTVRFNLRMETFGSPAAANGIWFLPSIRNEPVAPVVTPTLTQTPYP